MTKGDLKNFTLGKKAQVDYAKPQGWVNKITKLGIDHNPYVWGYTKDKFDQPIQLNDEFVKKIANSADPHLLFEIIRRCTEDKEILWKIAGFLYKEKKTA